MPWRCPAAPIAVCLTSASMHAQPAAPLVTAADSAAHLYRGAQSGFPDAARLVVRDADGWRRTWAALAAGRPDATTPPAIDFRREIVVVAALGARLGAGHAIVVDTVRRAGEVIEAVVRTVAPGAGCAGRFAVTEPVDVVRVPRSERPVTFVERRATAPCGG